MTSPVARPVLDRKKRARRWGVLGIVLATVVIVGWWTTAVSYGGGFLGLDGQLAWIFTARWSALAALLVMVVAGTLVHLIIRTVSDAPERPSAAELATPESAATKILDFRRSGLKGLVIGADGRASTSQLQAVLWTAALLYGLIFLLFLARSPNCPLPGGVTPVDGACPRVAGGGTFAATLGDDFRWEYLWLIGWPLAVAVTARKQVLDGLKKLRAKDDADAAQAGTPQASGTTANVPVDGKVTPVSAKAPPTTSDSIGFTAGVRDLFCNDRGQGSLMDTQILAFTLVTIAYFLVEVLSHPARGLPEIPAALLVLMGISGSGYLTAKAIDPLGTAGTAASSAQPGLQKAPELDRARHELTEAQDRAARAEAERDALRQPAADDTQRLPG